MDAFKLWCWRRLLRVPWTVRRSNPSILKEINPEYSLGGLMLKLKLQYFGHLMRRADSLENYPDAGEDWGQEEKETTEDETVGWHHQLDGHEFEQALGVGVGQGSLACCSPWGHKESEWLSNSVQFNSVTQSCPTIFDPMDCSMPGFPAHHQFQELAQTHVHLVGDAIEPISFSVVLFSSWFQSSPPLGSFLMSQFLISGGQSIDASASVSVLIMKLSNPFLN